MFRLQEAYHASRYSDLTNDFSGYVFQSMRPIPVSRDTGQYSLPELDFGLARWTKRGWFLGTTPLTQKEGRLKETFVHFTIDAYCTPTARSYFAGRGVGYNDFSSDELFSEVQMMVERAVYRTAARGSSQVKKQHGMGFDIPPLPWYDLGPNFFMDSYVSGYPKTNLN